ncbi:MAG: response regulator [Zetaproteobacteria bacterium CG_4_9_14_3_um_filter_49_83]|nr:MAG: response regulator [Zetaproteobacteria bacterium CG1_02_49_23]PIQ34937.1 MAG: response regulator [Zetaproteobacteria bacterium CG17_big_fil_post_rev_8_21_14_2_50_50_13]PIV31436.1 MAG: response regulator [Zetaproteobacteria bacterium CG02_land_8_20_14_3_00_50_9]PIY55041.1 MAG: response regulator [Zetaproteobacteria bacterium CG_4_10_14_0_8_um_filter_49_80]PJA36508.1 MAG: response regulator [Zetaproteobacteria bacterium CG_4_9_14_3_um_filter_49_83]
MKTILVVEDSGSSRDITSHFLQQGGFRVLEAEDGEVALAIIKSQHVDLILTDIMMPKMDGWALYREVRKDHKFNLTPFVFLTVLDELESQIKGLSLGVDDYITKPVTPQQLIARVNTTLLRSERLSAYFYINPVSDLGTPGYLRHRLQTEAVRCRAANQHLSLVIFGIGNYVSLVVQNAQWFAESCSREAGKLLLSKAREYDVVADMGQGCFAILLPNISADKANPWAANITNKARLSQVWPDTEQQISIDLGFSCDSISPGDQDPIELLNKQLASFERKW